MSSYWNKVRRDVTPEDLQIIRESWQFVQVLAQRTEEAQEDLTPPTASIAEPHVLNSMNSNWEIQYWLGDANLASMMTVASGSELYGGSGNIQSGTDKQAAANAAITVVHYAHLQKWPGILIIDGTKFMQWAVWAACQQYNLPCEGFEPDADDIGRVERCEHMLSAFKDEPKVLHKLSPFNINQGEEEVEG